MVPDVEFISEKCKLHKPVFQENSKTSTLTGMALCGIKWGVLGHKLTDVFLCIGTG
jgi:hypothetical protein